MLVKTGATLVVCVGTGVIGLHVCWWGRTDVIAETIQLSIMPSRTSNGTAPLLKTA